MRLVETVLPETASGLQRARDRGHTTTAAILEALAVLVIVFVALPAGAVELLVARVRGCRTPKDPSP